MWFYCELNVQPARFEPNERTMCDPVGSLEPRNKKDKKAEDRDEKQKYIQANVSIYRAHLREGHINLHEILQRIDEFSLRKEMCLKVQAALREAHITQVVHVLENE